MKVIYEEREREIIALMRRSLSEMYRLSDVVWGRLGALAAEVLGPYKPVQISSDWELSSNWTQIALFQVKPYCMGEMERLKLIAGRDFT